MDGIGMFDSSGGSTDTLPGLVHGAIPVKSLECGNSLMNSDMCHAMNADSFPTIIYELKKIASSVESDTGHNGFRINTEGKLSIAGTIRDVSILVMIAREQTNTFRITGSKVLSMNDFGITPPSALFGLVKADDRLVVRFDLVVSEDPLRGLERSR